MSAAERILEALNENYVTHGPSDRPWYAFVDPEAFVEIVDRFGDPSIIRDRKFVWHTPYGPILVVSSFHLPAGVIAMGRPIA